ncbi:acyltransferase-like protein [Tamaricihabitans halophyticus]|uniref:Acyltransferase-like protein n=1 Tax=Tamaricihabitans halophyticus TaxID=1262583 RepID=A0A4R2QA24_9PSEU|nr:acyltransferase [Tamaricihabitans halophyticus]TCP43645.1 acyltransferase-like protein [Tamaricihabitans halophyticus]
MPRTIEAKPPPATRKRDPFLDLVRAGAILLVVGQHWLMPVLDFHNGQLATGNALSTPGWWLFTWVSQVMPLVFFAGGAANFISLRAQHSRNGTTAEWLANRLHRLLLPVLALIAVWVPLPPLLAALGVPVQPLDIAGGIAAQLLWFLVVYLGTVLITPLAVRAHERFGLAVPGVLALASVLVDVARFDGVPLVGYANAVFVWFAVHQLGFHYVDGFLRTASRARAAGLLVGGYAMTAALVAVGPYPASMVGMPDAPVSNMSPPTACLLAVTCGQIGLMLLLRPLLLRLVRRPALGTALSWIGSRSMTVYLWHMPALIAVAGLAVLGFGYATPEPGSAPWFAVAPLWLGVLGLTLAGLVRLFGGLEAVAKAPRSVPPRTQLVIGGLLAAAGLLGLAAGGFGAPTQPGVLALLEASPLLPSAAVLLGFVLVSQRFRPAIQWTAQTRRQVV